MNADGSSADARTEPLPDEQTHSTPTLSDPQARPKRRTSVRNLLLATGVTFGFVIVLVLLVPRPSSVPRPAADLPGTAAGAADRLTFIPAITIPKGWTATSADVRTDSGDQATWTVNYLTDQGRYVGLMQAGAWNEKWQNSLTQGGTPQGSLMIGGRSWQVLVKPEKELTALLLKQDQVTTLVEAKGGGLDDARVLAQSVSPPS